MLEGFDSLDELLASRPADYSPPGFWELFEKETHASKRGPEGQATEIVQVGKIEKAVDEWIGRREAQLLFQRSFAAILVFQLLVIRCECPLEIDVSYRRVFILKNSSAKTEEDMGYPALNHHATQGFHALDNLGTKSAQVVFTNNRSRFRL